MADYTISDLASLCGITRRNIHFYIQQGLLPPPDGAGLAARYRDEHLLKLKAIPVLRRLGMRLDGIRERLSGMDERALQALLAERADMPTTAGPPTTGQLAEPTLHAQRLSRYVLGPGVELLVDTGNTGINGHQISELIRLVGQVLGHPNNSNSGRNNEHNT